MFISLDKTEKVIQSILDGFEHHLDLGLAVLLRLLLSGVFLSDSRCFGGGVQCHFVWDRVDVLHDVVRVFCPSDSLGIPARDSNPRVHCLGRFAVSFHS